MSSLNLDVSVLGQVLTVAQKLAIRNALLKIKLQENLADIRFWGKVNGATQDYFIAVSTTLTNAISKNFYWSNDEGATFAQLPSPDEFVSFKAPKIRGLFSGNPALKFKDPDAPPKVDEDGNPIEDEEEEEEEEEAPVDEDEVDEEGNPIVRPPPPRRLTELERLAFSVRAIDDETALVPRGAYFASATGALARNPAFDGLSLEESRKLSSYLVLRTPVLATTLAAIRKAGVSNHHDFLDPVQAPNAKQLHTWALHVGDSGLDVSLRSLAFPGYEYTLEAGSNNYSGAYFGSGERNADLLFML